MPIRRLVAIIFFFGIFLFVSWQLCRLFSPFYQAFFWAGILSFAFYPVYEAILSRLRNENLSAILTTLIVFVVVVVPSVFVLINIVNQTFDIIHYLAGGGLESVWEELRSIPWIQTARERVSGSEVLSGYIADWPGRIVTTLANSSASYLGAAMKNTLVITFNFVIMIFLLAILTREGRRIYRFIYDIVPFEDHDKERIFSKITETFASVIRGQFFTSLVQSALAGLTFLFLGLPAPYFFGFATFVSSLIPFVGSSGVWLPVAVYLLVQKEFAKGIILMLVGTFVISLSDNILKPAVIGKRMKMPPFLLFFGILGGMRYYGLMGVFLGPLLITLFFVLLKIYRENYGP